MPTIFVTDPRTNTRVPVNIDGDVPTPTELRRIQDWQSSVAVPVAPAPEPEPESGGVLGGLGTFATETARGFGQSFSDLPGGIGGLVESGLGYTPGSTEIGGRLEDISTAGREAITGALGAPEEGLAATAGQAVGSLASFLVPGAAGFKAAGALGAGVRGASAAAGATAGTMGAGLGSAEQLARIEQRLAAGEQVPEDDIRKATMIGGAIGVTEGIPVGRIAGRTFDLLRKVPKEGRDEALRTITGRLQRAGASALEEGGQELFAGIAQDLTEKNIYNPDLQVGQSAAQDFAVGAGAGAVLQGILDTVAGRRMAARDELTADVEQEAADVEQRRANVEARRAEREGIVGLLPPPTRQITYDPDAGLMDRGQINMPPDMGPRTGFSVQAQRDADVGRGAIRPDRAAAQDQGRLLGYDPEARFSDRPEIGMPSPGIRSGFGIQEERDALAGRLAPRPDRAALQDVGRLIGYDPEARLANLPQQDMTRPDARSGISLQQDLDRKSGQQQAMQDAVSDVMNAQRIDGAIARQQEREQADRMESSGEQLDLFDTPRLEGVETDASVKPTEGGLDLAPDGIAVVEEPTQGISDITDQGTEKADTIELEQPEDTPVSDAALEREETNALTTTPDSAKPQPTKVDTPTVTSKRMGLAKSQQYGIDKTSYRLDVSTPDGTSRAFVTYKDDETGQFNVFNEQDPSGDPIAGGFTLAETKAQIADDLAKGREPATFNELYTGKPSKPEVVSQPKASKPLKTQGRKAERDLNVGLTTQALSKNAYGAKSAYRVSGGGMSYDVFKAPTDLPNVKKGQIAVLAPDQDIEMASYAGDTLDQAIENTKADIQKFSRTKTKKSAKVRANEAADSPLTDIVSLTNPRLAVDVRRYLDSKGFQDVGVSLERTINNDPAIAGAFDPREGKKLIALAVDIYDPSLTDAQLKAEIAKVIDHELIHAARATGGIDADAFNNLARVAGGTKKVGSDGKKKSYTYLDYELARNQALPEEARLDADGVIEEAAAEMYKDWASGDLKLAGRPQGTFQKLTNLIKNIAMPFRDRGVTRASDLFSQLNEGVLDRPGVFSNDAEGIDAAVKYSQQIKNSDAFKRFVDAGGYPEVLYRGVQLQGQANNDIYRKVLTGLSNPNIPEEQKEMAREFLRTKEMRQTAGDLSMMNLEASKQYGSVFASSNPYNAAEYSGIEGRGNMRPYIMPILIRPKEIIEAPITETFKNSRGEMVNDFDMNVTDRMAKELEPGQAMVIRQTRDFGITSPTEMAQYGIHPSLVDTPADVWAIHPDTEMGSIFDLVNPYPGRVMYSRSPDIPVSRIDEMDFEVEYASTNRVAKKYIGKLTGQDFANRYVDEFQSKFQDQMLPVAQIIDDFRKRGVKITDAMDGYRQEEIMHGIQGELTRQRENGLYADAVAPLKMVQLDNKSLGDLRNVSLYFKEREQRLEEGRQSLGGKFKNIMGMETSRKQLVGDAYLYALHAKERNAEIRRIRKVTPNDTAPEQISGSGMSDQEADAILAWVDRQDAATKGALEQMSRGVQAIITDTNTLRTNYGLIPEEFTTEYEDADGNLMRVNTHYENYVPLRGKLGGDGELEDSTLMGSGVGLGAFGKEDKSALGRSEAAAISPIEMAMIQNANAIRRGERNKVMQAFANLSRDPSAQKNGIGDFIEEVTVAEAGRIAGKDAKGFFRFYPDPSFGSRPDIMPFKESGKQRYLRIKDDRMARALKKAANPKTMNAFIKTMAGFNRYLANINTSYNPEFLFSNFFRDIEAAWVNASQYDVKEAQRETIKAVPASVKTLKQFFWDGKEGSGEQAVFDTPFTKASDKQRQARVREFMEQGGRNLSNQMATLGDAETNVRRVVKDIGEAESMAGRGRDKVKAGFFKLGESLEAANDIVENASRFALYNTLRERGISKEKAAQAARNLTTNFTKKGEWGQELNTFYLFYNASLQGSMAMLNAVTRSRKAQALVASFAAAGAAADMLAAAMSAEDEDGIKVYDKMPDYVLEHNIIIPDITGATERGFFTIPLSYGLNMFWNTGRTMSRIARGGYTGAEAANTIWGTVLETFNPFGGENWLTNVSPTVSDPAVELMMNQGFNGRAIYKEGFPGDNTPTSYLYWNSTSPTFTGLTEFLNDATGGTSKVEGMINVNPDVLEYFVDYLTGAAGRTILRVGELPGNVIGPALEGEMDVGLLREIPMARKLFTTTTEREDLGLFMDGFERVKQARDEFKEAQDTADRPRMERAMETYKKELRVYGVINNLNNARRKLNQQAQAIRDNKQLSDERKQQVLDNIDKRVQEIISRGNSIIKDL